MVANKISYLSIREQNKNRITSSFQNDNLAKEINAGLAFKLTDDQVSAYEEIRADIATQTPMLRLLQGDVGSGKTIVAGLVAAHVVEDKRQVAILAPTTILANQHYQNFVEWFGALSGDVAGVTPEGAAEHRISWPALVAQEARAPPKSWDGTGRRRAPDATNNVFWSTCAPKAMENERSFQH